MKKYNSTKSRVEPVFDALLSSDPTGSSWLGRMLTLPNQLNGASAYSLGNPTLVRHGWGVTEMRLDPPLSLLSWLLRHPRKPQHGILSKDSVKAEKRQRWIDGDDETIKEGLKLLRHSVAKEDWHIFEGVTQPDVYLETDNLIVVIEAKRTEDGPTTRTKWMGERHQMLRHIDCAWEVRGTKNVLGFFIVEGKGNSEDVPDDWVHYGETTLSVPAISSSLPHRGPIEQEQIAGCFAGVTTWQKVCHEFEDLGLSYQDLPKTIDGIV